jgi:hypothetical protein
LCCAALGQCPSANQDEFRSTLVNPAKPRFPADDARRWHPLILIGKTMGWNPMTSAERALSGASSSAI